MGDEVDSKFGEWILVCVGFVVCFVRECVVDLVGVKH